MGEGSLWELVQQVEQLVHVSLPAHQEHCVASV